MRAWLLSGVGLVLLACGGGGGAADSQGGNGPSTAAGAATESKPKVPTESVECGLHNGSVSVQIQVDADGKPVSVSGKSEQYYNKICASGTFFSSDGTFSGKITRISKVRDNAGEDGVLLTLSEGTSTFDNEQWTVTDEQAQSAGCETVNAPSTNSSAAPPLESIAIYNTADMTTVVLNLPQGAVPDSAAQLLATESECVTTDTQTALYKALAAYAQ